VSDDRRPSPNDRHAKCRVDLLSKIKPQASSRVTTERQLAQTPAILGAFSGRAASGNPIVTGGAGGDFRRPIWRRCDMVVIHHDAKNSAPRAKKPRGASSIDSWWDWKVSINVDPEDDSLKQVFFGRKAGQPIAPLAVQFQSHPAMGVRIAPVVRA
jgi:hypothetical protein